MARRWTQKGANSVEHLSQLVQTVGTTVLRLNIEQLYRNRIPGSAGKADPWEGSPAELVFYSFNPTRRTIVNPEVDGAFQTPVNSFYRF